MPRQSSIANQTVGAGIPDFDFPVTFEVTGFKFKVPGRAAMFINGNSLSSSLLVLLRI